MRIMPRLATAEMCLLGFLCSCATQPGVDIPSLRIHHTQQTFSGLGSDVERVMLEGGDSIRAATPFHLSASDGTGLHVDELRVEAVIRGPLAFSELHLTLRNPTAERIEGRFEVELPESAAVSRLAMMIDHQWMEGELVARPRAHLAYESNLHQRIDPAMLELAGGNRYRARIFPIEAHQRRRVVISYTHVLPPSGAYRFRLRGMPKLGLLQFDIRAGAEKHHLRRARIRPTRDFSFTPKNAPSGVRSGSWVAARVAIPIEERKRSALSGLLIMVDTSASRAGVGKAQWAALRHLIATLQQKYGRAFPIEVAAFDQRAQTIFRGAIGDFGSQDWRALRLRGYFGATDFGRATSFAAKHATHGRVIFVSDGEVTAGPYRRVHGSDDLRFDVLAIAGDGNYGGQEHLVRHLAGKKGRVIAAEKRPADLITALETEVLSAGLTIPDAKRIWPQEIYDPGATALVFAELKAPSDRLRVLIGDKVREAKLGAAPASLVKRAWARAQIASLRSELRVARSRNERSALREKLAVLGREARILSDGNALVVLESESDYARWKISREARRELRIQSGTLKVTLVGEVAKPPAKKKKANKRRVRKRRRSGKFRGRRTRSRAGGSSTTGEIVGRVIDRGTGRPVIGATIVALSPALQGTQAAISNAAGSFKITGLPPGPYTVTFTFGDLTITRLNINVRAERSILVDGALDQANAGRKVVVKAKPPSIDTANTKQSTTLGEDYLTRTPVPGRTFENALGAAPGSTGESLGKAFAGSSARENRYIASRRAEPSGFGMAKIAARPLELKDLRPLARAVARVRARPLDTPGLLSLGRMLELRGATILAARVYGSIIDLHPRRDDYRRMAAARLVALDSQALSTAIHSFQEAIRLRPKRSTGHRQLAYALVRAKKFRAAFDALEAYIKEHADTPQARLLGGDLALIGHAWVAAEPAVGSELKQRLADVDARFYPTDVRFALFWESDVTDLNLALEDVTHKRGAKETRWSDNRTQTGFGPEVIDYAIDETRKIPIEVVPGRRGPTGMSAGTLQIVSMNEGTLQVLEFPFVLKPESETAHLVGTVQIQATGDVSRLD